MAQRLVWLERMSELLCYGIETETKQVKPCRLIVLILDFTVMGIGRHT